MRTEKRYPFPISLSIACLVFIIVVGEMQILTEKWEIILYKLPRKVSRNKSSFPDDDSIYKVIKKIEVCPCFYKFVRK